MAVRGVVGLCRLACALPASAPVAAAEIGVSPEGAARMLRDLRRVGAAVVVGSEQRGKTGARAHVVAMAMTGEALRDARLQPTRYAGNGRRMPVNAVAVRELWFAMVEGGGTVADLSEACGLHRTAVRRALAAFKAGGKARIGRWVHLGNGWAPYWVLGCGRDAARPRAADRKVVNARYWARRRERLRFDSVQAALVARDAA